MKRKGFTLIELLAVIVILAIIALIATPIVLNIIENSKDSSNKRSIELYGSAVEQAVAKAKLNGNTLPSGKYTTTDGKTLKQGDTEFKVDYDGSKTACDVIISTKGNIYLENCKVNDKTTEYTYGEKVYYNGEVVYFDVASGKQCSEKEYNDSYGDVTALDYNENKEVTIQDYQNSNTGYNGTNSKDKQNSCLKFYAFNDDGGDKVNLILDHNTTIGTNWGTYSYEEKSDGTVVFTVTPGEVFTQLKTDTASWIGTETPSNYTMDQRGQHVDNLYSDVYYTIDYSDYKARLITAQEIAQITGNTTWNETTASYNDWYYLDSKTTTESDTCKEGNTSGCKYGWLYDRVSPICKLYGHRGCLNTSDGKTYGYWTSSTSVPGYGIWYFDYAGNMWNDTSYYFSDSVGVRPVIEVLKSKLN